MANVTKGDPYENLANAIILSAVEDYRRALRRYTRNQDSKSSLADVEREEKIFRSDWYSVLTTVDGEFLIRKICSEFGL